MSPHHINQTPLLDTFIESDTFIGIMGSPLSFFNNWIQTALSARCADSARKQNCIQTAQQADCLEVRPEPYLLIGPSYSVTAAYKWRHPFNFVVSPIQHPKTVSDNYRSLQRARRVLTLLPGIMIRQSNLLLVATVALCSRIAKSNAVTWGKDAYETSTEPGAET